MYVLESDNVVFADCDDTLVLWGRPEGGQAESLEVGQGDYVELVYPHWVHVQKLREHKARGHKVVVWSQGGYEWARAVVKALDIEDVVDAVMRKPTWCMDDMPASAYMPQPYWVKPE